MTSSRFGAYALLIILCLNVRAATIKFTVPTDIDALYLLAYHGDGVRMVDSVAVVAGEGIYSCEARMDDGVYFISHAAGAERVDILVGAGQDFEVNTQFDVLSTRINGSVESQIFLDYQKQASRQILSQNISFIENALHQLDPASFCYLVLKALLPAPTSGSGSSLIMLNQEASLEYNLSHYWDNYDLTDARLLNTPFFAPQVNSYVNKVLPLRTDLIMTSIESLLTKTDGELALQKIIVSNALALAVKDQIMGIDALGYELITRYYLSGLFGDLPIKQKQMLEDYVKHTESCRLGMIAKDIALDGLDADAGGVSLHNLESKYTLVLFWEPDCEYCKHVVPILRDDILPKYEAAGLSVFAVNTQSDYSTWQSYILDNKIANWMHAYDSMGQATFMVDYGVQGTPTMYILDSDMKIVAKNVKLDYLRPMLDRLFVTGSIY